MSGTGIQHRQSRGGNYGNAVENPFSKITLVKSTCRNVKIACNCRCRVSPLYPYSCKA